MAGPGGGRGCRYSAGFGVKNGRHVRNRRDLIDLAGRHRAGRHAIVRGIFRALHQNEPAGGLYRRQTERAIGAGARKDDADRAPSIRLGHGVQQEIERQARAMAFRRLGYMQHTARDGQAHAGRRDVEVVRPDLHSLGRLDHRHGRMGCEQFDNHAVVPGHQVLHQNEGHSGLAGDFGKELGVGFKAPGRSADGNDREGLVAG